MFEKRHNEGLINIENVVEKVSSIDIKDTIKMHLTTSMLLTMKIDEFSEQQLEDLILIVKKLNSSLELKLEHLRSNPEYLDVVKSLNEIISKYK